MDALSKTIGDIGISVFSVICLGMAIFALFCYPPSAIVGLLLVGISTGICDFIGETRNVRMFRLLAYLGFIPALVIAMRTYPPATSNNSDVFSVGAGMCLAIVIFATTYTTLHKLRESNA